MAVEPDDILLDVLYEEIDAESGEAKEALTPKLLAELEGWREFRESLGSDFQVFEPNPSVRASILELAAKELNESVNEAHVDSAIRRPPAHPEKGGFWKKLAGQSSQIALVATVLLVGAFVMNFQKRDAAMGPSIEEVGYPSPSPSLPVADSLPAEAPEGDAVRAENEAALAVAEVLEEPKAAEPTPEPVEELSADQVAQLRAAEERIVPSEKPATRTRTSSKRALKPAARPQSPSGEVALVDDFAEKSKKETASTSNRASAPSAARPARPTESLNDSATLSKGAGAVLDEDRLDVQEEKPAPKKDVAAPVGTLDSVEAAYRARDYRRVISESQQVMNSTATAIQRARALELRAQAYKQMGMLQQAMETYRNLEANYPTYQTERVRASRVEVERQMESTPQPASRPRQNRSYDFESESVIDKMD